MSYDNIRNMTFHKGSNYSYSQQNKTDDPVEHIKTQILNITKSPHKGHFKLTPSIMDQGPDLH